MFVLVEVPDNRRAILEAFVKESIRDSRVVAAGTLGDVVRVLEAVETLRRDTARRNAIAAAAPYVAQPESLEALEENKPMPIEYEHRPEPDMYAACEGEGDSIFAADDKGALTGPLTVIMTPEQIREARARADALSVFFANADNEVD